jgi:hypothetical protein
MMRHRSTLVAIGGALLLATMFVRPAAAQTMADDAVQARRPPARPRRQLGVRAFAALDADSLAASSTFDAVLGTHVLAARGGGAELLNVWKGLFIRVAATSASKTGSRVVVVDKQAVSLGIPLTIEMMPVEFGAGWRSSIGQRQQGAWYVGGGLLHAVYRETSTFATVGDNTDTTFNGGVVFVGADVKLWHFIVGGGEVQFRSLPNALGDGGASQAFNETNLGGATVRGVIGVRF